MLKSVFKKHKKFVAMMLALVMAFSTCVPVSATEEQPEESSNITVSVKVRTTALNGEVIVSDENVTLPKGATVLDALKEVSGTDEENVTDIDGVKHYSQGIFKWHSTFYGENFIDAVKVDGHSLENRFFEDNGTASDWDEASNRSYSYLNYLNNLEKVYYGMKKVNSTFNNKVNENDYLSEGDYNRFSGWMVIVNGHVKNMIRCGETVFNETSTVLKDKDEVDLNFTMFMGLDLGQDSWVYTDNDCWVTENAWNTYSYADKYSNDPEVDITYEDENVVEVESEDGIERIEVTENDDSRTVEIYNVDTGEKNYLTLNKEDNTIYSSFTDKMLCEDEQDSYVIPCATTSYSTVKISYAKIRNALGPVTTVGGVVGLILSLIPGVKPVGAVIGAISTIVSAGSYGVPNSSKHGLKLKIKTVKYYRNRCGKRRMYKSVKSIVSVSRY